MTILEHSLRADHAATHTQRDPIGLSGDDFDTIVPYWDTYRGLNYGSKATIVKGNAEQREGMRAQRADYILSGSLRSKNDDLYALSSPFLQAFEQLDVLIHGCAWTRNDEIEALAKRGGQKLIERGFYQIEFW